MAAFKASNAMLTGSDLLNRVKELGDISKTDLARGCGYVSTKKDGGELVEYIKPTKVSEKLSYAVGPLSNMMVLCCAPTLHS